MSREKSEFEQARYACKNTAEFKQEPLAPSVEKHAICCICAKNKVEVSIPAENGSKDAVCLACIRGEH